MNLAKEAMIIMTVVVIVIITFLIPDELVLYPVEKYHYLKQSKCVSDPSINDKEDFQKVLVKKIENIFD
jgi:hypothetical protein